MQGKAIILGHYELRALFIAITRSPLSVDTEAGRFVLPDLDVGRLQVRSTIGLRYGRRLRPALELSQFTDQTVAIITTRADLRHFSGRLTHLTGSLNNLRP